MSEQIKQMFSRVAARYDLVNTLLSFGMHHRWRKTAVQLVQPPRDGKVLDLACGTGDLALAFSRVMSESAVIVASDFSAEMLRHAERKFAGTNITTALADAMSLQHADESFDVCSIAFGIRNVDDPVTALREMHRVVRARGKILVLEFGQPTGWFGTLYRWYSRVVIPKIGGLVSSDGAAYEYLHASSSAFPCGEEFMALMRRSGIESIETKRLLFGAVWVYVGMK